MVPDEIETLTKLREFDLRNNFIETFPKCFLSMTECSFHVANKEDDEKIILTEIDGKEVLVIEGKRPRHRRQTRANMPRFSENIQE